MINPIDLLIMRSADEEDPNPRLTYPHLTLVLGTYFTLVGPEAI